MIVIPHKNYASPHGACMAGEKINLPNAVAQALLRDKQAVLADSPPFRHGAAQPAAPPAGAKRTDPDQRLQVSVDSIIENDAVVTRLHQAGIRTVAQLQAVKKAPSGISGADWSDVQRQLADYVKALH